MSKFAAGTRVIQAQTPPSTGPAQHAPFSRRTQHARESMRGTAWCCALAEGDGQKPRETSSHRLSAFTGRITRLLHINSQAIAICGYCNCNFPVFFFIAIGICSGKPGNRWQDIYRICYPSRRKQKRSEVYKEA